jgi:hypothetical protein
VSSRVGPLCFICPLSESVLHTLRITAAAAPPSPSLLCINAIFPRQRSISRSPKFVLLAGIQTCRHELLHLPAHQPYARHLWTCSPFFNLLRSMPRRHQLPSRDTNPQMRHTLTSLTPLDTSAPRLSSPVSSPLSACPHLCTATPRGMPQPYRRQQTPRIAERAAHVTLLSTNQLPRRRT